MAASGEGRNVVELLREALFACHSDWGSCSTPHGSGECKHTQSCSVSYTSYTGYCTKAPQDIRCCVKNQGRHVV